MEAGRVLPFQARNRGVGGEGDDARMVVGGGEEGTEASGIVGPGRNVGNKRRAEERRVGLCEGTREEKRKEGKGTGGMD